MLYSYVEIFVSLSKTIYECLVIVDKKDINYQEFIDRHCQLIMWTGIIF